MARRKPVSVHPRINFGHPLAQGLAACFLFNEQGGLILTDLVTQRHATLQAGSAPFFGGHRGFDRQLGGNADTTTEWTLPNIDAYNSELLTIVWAGVEVTAEAYGGYFAIGNGSTNHFAIQHASSVGGDSYDFFGNNITGPKVTSIGLKHSVLRDGFHHAAFAANNGDYLTALDGQVIQGGAYTVGTTTAGQILHVLGARLTSGNVNVQAMLAHMYLYSGEVMTADKLLALYEDPYGFVQEDHFRRYVFLAGATAAAAPKSFLPRRDPLHALLVR
jgi:hypothetical protein